MELALSLENSSNKTFNLFEKISKPSSKDLGFCMSPQNNTSSNYERVSSMSSSVLPLQLDLLPPSPVPRRFSPSQTPFPWFSDHNVGASPVSGAGGGGFDVNCRVSSAEEETASLSPPNSSGVSAFRTEINGMQNETERGSSRGLSDDEDNGLGRKKLRLSKEQSAFLEESFKEHNTLNPKQKLALAKQLNLRPRQVEVWFQNRRARTKLKQTEVDCEHLKRWCETLTEENKRLQKELHELRALKSSQPFFMQLPATTLTMCPSCERVSSSTTATTSPAVTTAASTDKPVSPSAKTTTLSLS